jgi:hypothetical protein
MEYYQGPVDLDARLQMTFPERQFGCTSSLEIFSMRGMSSRLLAVYKTLYKIDYCDDIIYLILLRRLLRDARHPTDLAVVALLDVVQSS